jgi:TPR repeat protein
MSWEGNKHECVSLRERNTNFSCWALAGESRAELATVLGIAGVGDPFYQYKMGAIGLLGEASQRHSAVDALELSAEQGNSDGLWRFGTLLRDDDLVARDVGSAIDHFIRSARANNANGKVCLANALLTGSGVEPDPARAVELLKEAADSGNATAMWCLANCLCKGIGCEANAVGACRWFKRLADLGDMDGQYHLAKMRINGVQVSESGVVQNVPLGVRYMKQAADSGHSVALWRVGFLYQNGLVLERDLPRGFVLQALC